MNYRFLALQCSPPLMHPRGSIYCPSIGNEGSSRSVSRHMEGQESSYSGLIEENSKSFLFLCTFPNVCGLHWSNIHVHVYCSLKVMYRNKQVFFREFLGTSKYNSSKGGLMSLQRDMEAIIV